MKKFVLLFTLLFMLTSAFGQFYQQYFDGADTSQFNSLFIEIDTTGGNIWQIGPPQKVIFNSASTIPNVIVTDTVNSYPINDTSSFVFGVPKAPWFSGILALNWIQKIDMDSSADWGMIELSLDTGATWSNVMYSPYTYNFYGFNFYNVDTISPGEYGFTGTDSTWKNIWLCYDLTWANMQDSIMLKYTFISDSIHSNKEGWMIDNYMASTTFIHTVNEVEQEELIKVSPSLTSDRVDINIKTLKEPHAIKSMSVIDIQGKVLQQYGQIPSKFFVNLNSYPDGIYFINVETNYHSETFKVVLQKK